MALKHDDITKMLAKQIEDGIAKIDAANDVLLANESGTSVRDIDKALKAEAEKAEKFSKTGEGENSELPSETLEKFAEAQAAYEVYRAAIDVVRNSYRTLVLNESEQASVPENLKDETVEVRKLVMDALGFLKTYATGNGKTDIVEWANGLAIPQVGRKGTSNVGQKKPRVRVKIGDTVYESFGEAAKFLSGALSDENNKVTVTPGELAEAWNEQETFDFKGHTLVVTLKNPKAA